ncbi:hypothetical protein F5887DRAFT_950459 [Amanita rubescens]|nr:hypothetical protein F5887DRAFT_950459 [Amanita rubescens]
MAQLDIPTLVQHQFYLRFADTAALSMLVYDYLLTFDLEVNYVWGSRWTFVKLLYLVVRYMPFVTMASVFLLDVPGPTVEDCLSITRAYAIMITFDTGFGEIILTLRTWAICGRRFRMGMGFLFFFLIKTAIAYIILAFWWSSLQYAVIPPGLGYSSGTCVLVKASKVIWGSWTLVVVFEFIVCILLAREALSAYRLGGMSQLAWVVYRDGLMYYVYLMATFVGVAASVIVLPFDMVRFLSGPAHVLHVLLTARVILHAREQANKSTIHEISSSFFTQSC